ncbi:MAG: MFS transporter [Candidatus Omnitrophica bacterium]|nr:MFS transporter [Candidatus Omnitrophota bacterium]
MRNQAFYIILLFGLVSLFGDIVYEGIRSINGPFLASLGASAFIIGFFSGLGEFLTYSLRFFTGYFSDKKKSYWLFTIIGYLSICFLPLLAFAKSWEIAVLLLLIERTGKAIRTPARDVLISIVGKNIGYGKSFGIHEVLDQIGAFLGPFIFFYSLKKFGNYSFAFHLMWFPCFFLVCVIIILKKIYSFAVEIKEIKQDKESPNYSLIFYLFFIFFSIVGLVNFPIIAYHIKNTIPLSNIPLFYTLSMAIDGIIALIIGNLYDRIKFKTLIVVPVFTIFIPILIFNLNFPLLGVIILGIIIGCHETILRAVIADLVRISQRGFVYGIFNTIYGFGLFIGSGIVGFLYERNFKIIWFYVFIVEIISLIFLYLQKINMKNVEKNR